MYRPCHCVKNNRVRSFFGLYFPAFGLNTDQKKSEYGHFSRIFTNQLNLVIDYVAHPSLHTNWHHQIVCCSSNPCIKCSSPLERLVEDYKNSDTEKIKKFFEQVYWKNMFYHRDPNQEA